MVLSPGAPVLLPNQIPTPTVTLPWQFVTRVFFWSFFFLPYFGLGVSLSSLQCHLLLPCGGMKDLSLICMKPDTNNK